MDSLKIAIIAGEPSGDMLAALLMTALKKHAGVRQIEFMGIGGSNMINEGLHSVSNMDTLAVAGYGLDVLLAIPKIYCLFRQVTREIINFKPDIFIGVDAPDFNFHVERKLKNHGIRTVHYISPTIWAWRYERIYKIKKSTDLVLCIFPMEEEIYLKEGISAKFIGNPLADKIPFHSDKYQYRNELVGNLDILNHKFFTILVGSRKYEINKLAKIFIATCNIIAQKIKDCVFLFPFAKQTAYDAFEGIIQENLSIIDFKYKLILNKTRQAIQSADLVLAKSGTVTLEVALYKKPMIISYKVSAFTEYLIKRKIKIKYVGQPNILLNEAVIPELLQGDANPEKLAEAMLDLYADTKRQEYMIARFEDLHKMLKYDAANTGAEVLLKFISGV